MTRIMATACLAVLCAVVDAAGQTADTSRPFAWDVARAVLIDPTTYVPAIVKHEAMKHDWKTSQALFAHGWLEANPKFTVSGRPNDVPLSYDAGNRYINREALAVLGYSALNNLAAGVGERLIAEKYPRHRTLIRVVSWTERIGFASILVYANSAGHLRQARLNQRWAREYGYARQGFSREAAK